MESPAVTSNGRPDFIQPFRMRQLFNVIVASDAFEGSVGGCFQGGRVEARGTPAWRSQSSGRICADCWPQRPVVSRVAVTASGVRFTAVMVRYFSTSQSMRDCQMRYNDLSILYCVEIYVKL